MNKTDINLPPVPPLNDVLTVGNFTGGTDIEISNDDIIKAVSGGGFLDLRFFSN